MRSSTDGSPTRVVILGGGIASLAAAWRLSERSDVTITVYQRGWRLGGKGASSRGRYGRVEEHGLHIWLGYYDNAFRLVRQCYEELDRPRSNPDCPIQTWTDGFRQADTVELAHRLNGSWDDWTAVFTPNDQLPGEPEIVADPMAPVEFVTRVSHLLQDFFQSLPDGDGDGDGDGDREAIVISGSPRPPIRRRSLTTLAGRALDAALAVVLEATRQAADAATAAPDVDVAVRLLEDLRVQLTAQVSANTARRHVFELVDLLVTNVRGVLADGLFVHPRGFAAANGEEYREWLVRHGITEQTLQSPLVNGVYDLVFGYRNGDPGSPSFAAGTGLFLGSKIFFDYKGSIFWKMQGGMGDVVFAPLYEALRRRGVRFEFFHEVDELALTDDGQAVEHVRLVRQSELAHGVDEYEPLVDFGGLPCFPAEPDQHQLASSVSKLLGTETLWGRPPDSAPVDLTRAADFDVVVFGISLGMVPYTCGELIDRSPAWRAMTEHLGTVATQAAQLWLRSTERELGWGHTGSTVTGYVKPFDTAASMSHLTSIADWPPGEHPGSIFYLCNTLPEPPPPGPEIQDYPERQHRRVRQHAIDFLAHDARHFLPGAYTDGEFDWAELVDGGAERGAARFDSQFWTANVDPSDRYVQSLPGTDLFRLRPDGSGFANLVLTGDWTDCGLNAGCIEAAVISGLQAANAITGDDRWSGISGDWSSLARI